MHNLAASRGDENEDKSKEQYTPDSSTPGRSSYWGGACQACAGCSAHIISFTLQHYDLEITSVSFLNEEN